MNNYKINLPENEIPKNYNVALSKLGLKGNWKVRDVWRQKNVSLTNGSFNTMIPFHGVSLYYIQPIHSSN